MLEYISDSENDSGGEINPETVSLTRMERVLSTFPMEDQIAITNSLQQSGYLIRHSQDNHVEDEGGNENLNHVNEEDENSTTRDDLDAASRVYNIDELFSDITYASQEIDETPKSQPQQQQIQVNAVRISQQSRPFFEPQPLSHGNASEEEEAENANHLRAYLGSKQSVYNRRGLRNRSFANAHPYLADSSHWMGLASISVLNDLYKENHDVELIVKILNQKYMKNKQKYPKDDKFKSKSFYAFLGKSRNSGSYNADIDDSNQEQNHQLQQTQDGESEQYSQPQDYYSEDENYESQRDSLGLLQGMNYDADIFNFPEDNYLGVSPRYEQDQYLENTTPDNDFQNNTLDNESQNEEGDDDDNDDEGKGEGEESEDEDETLVRVGGRLLKEKSVLRGTLPESAKRLSIYQPKAKVYQRHKPKVLEYRKGLAVKKKDASKPYASFQQDLNGFVDDNEYYNGMSDIYVRSPTLSPVPEIEVNHSRDINGPYAEFSPISDGSDEIVEIERDENSENDFNSRNEPSDWEVVEDDKIDPMFANSRNPSKTSKSRNASKRRKLSASGHISIPQRSFKSSTRALDNRSRQSILFGSQSLGFSRLSASMRFRDRTNDKTKTGRNLAQPNQQSRIPLSDIEPDNNKRPDTPRQQNKQNKHQYIVPDVNLKSRYDFSRNPVTSTVAIETDSGRSFIKRAMPTVQRSVYKKMGYKQQSRLGVDELEFPKGFILARIELSKLDSIKNGYTKLTPNGRDSIYFNLLGESYSFLLLNKSSSLQHVFKLLQQLSRILKDWRILSDPLLEMEIYNAIGGLIEWSLILQELPDQSCWQLLYNICHDFERISEKKFVLKKLFYFPYFILLLNIWILIGAGLGLNVKQKYPKDGSYFSKVYFRLLFENFTADEFQTNLEVIKREDFETGIFTFQFESLYSIFVVNRNRGAEIDNGNWWLAVDEGLKRVRMNGTDYLNILDLLYLLSISIAPRSFKNVHAWKPFYTFYLSFSVLEDLDSYIYDKFLNICFQLKDQFFWVIEERLIIMIYSKTITTRKFANFENENLIPLLLGKLVTRDSIPDTSFFDRFMYLLFSYVSELPVGDSKSNKKRLISKLFTSSHFIYKKGDPKHFAMYVNRLNFILLLSQLSNKIDQRGQLVDLIRHIEDSGDIDFYRVTCEGLDVYSEIVGDDVQYLPLESYSTIIDKIGNTYKTKKFHECLDIWEGMKLLIRKWSMKGENGLINILAVLGNINLNLFDDLFLIDISKMILRALNELRSKSSNLMVGNQVIRSICEANSSILQIQMGRLPLMDESKVSTIIEGGIRIWIISSYLLDPQINWNELIFQRYPYIGNSYLRNKFNLFFYNELLSFLKLADYFDTYLSLLLQKLVPGEYSDYQAILFNNLRNISSSTGVPYSTVFQFPKDINVPLSNLQFSKYKLLLTKYIFQNIVSSNITELAKEFYVKLFVDLLLKSIISTTTMSASKSDEYIKNIEILQKYCLRYVKNDISYKALFRNVGLLQSEVDAYSWVDLSLKSKLSLFHSEYGASVHKYGNQETLEIFKCISKFVKKNDENLDIVYHLVSIYMKAISNRQFDKWVLLYYLLDFLVHKLQICEVNITDGTYKTFLNLLSTLGSSGSNGRDNPYHDYRIMSLHATAELLTKTVFIYDGYKDIIQLKENIFKFISNLATNPDPIEIDSYSMLRIFDISNPSSEIKDFVTEVPIGAKVDEGSLKSLTISLENLIDLHTNNNTPNSRSLSDRTLSLDFDF